MRIKKSEANEFKNSDECTVWEYKVPSKTLSVTSAKITGRYPAKGKVANTKVDQTYFVIKGKGIIHSSKGDFEIEEGDIYFFEKNEEYWVETDDLYVLLSHSPPWTFEQFKVVD